MDHNTSTTSIRDLGLKVGSRIDTNRGTAVVVRVIDLDGEIGGLVDCPLHQPPLLGQVRLRGR